MRRLWPGSHRRTRLRSFCSRRRNAGRHYRQHGRPAGDLPRNRTDMTRRWSIAGQLFALQVLVVTLLVAGCTLGAILLARRDARNAAEQEVVAVAETIARSPAVIEALHTAEPSRVLQPYAEA